MNTTCYSEQTRGWEVIWHYSAFEATIDLFCFSLCWIIFLKSFCNLSIVSTVQAEAASWHHQVGILDHTRIQRYVLYWWRLPWMGGVPFHKFFTRWMSWRKLRYNNSIRRVTVPDFRLTFIVGLVEVFVLEM